ncbi:hypothetical protein Plhal703r1_c22g0095421 [Plasmopara halstedii]
MDQATSRCDDGKNIKTRRIWQRTDCKVRDRPKLAQNRFHISFKIGFIYPSNPNLQVNIKRFLYLIQNLVPLLRKVNELKHIVGYICCIKL